MPTLENGQYTGDFVSNLPHGKGELLYLSDDPHSRTRYYGDWCQGVQCGQGLLEFSNGDFLSGTFENGVPHGTNIIFTFANGAIEDATWVNGQREGPSRVTAPDGAVEETVFIQGKAEGSSVIINADKSVEEFVYNQGKRNGPAVLKFPNKDRLEFTYIDGVPSGKAILHTNDGCREEQTYIDGVLEGEATIFGNQGDTITFKYNKGIRSGTSLYKWADGTTEETTYDECGNQNGSARLVMVDGTIRTGNKTDGEWDGSDIKVYLPNGDWLELTYKNGIPHGPAILHWTQDNSWEELSFVNGQKQGSAIKYNDEDGTNESRTYMNDILEGPAVISKGDGDKFEFSYVGGIRLGSATYRWNDGTVEISTFDEDGNQNGPAKLVWPNGAVREGQKHDGLWNGTISYKYPSEGPRADQYDEEIWENGNLVSSRKLYKDDTSVENWEDLEKLPEVTETCQEGQKK